MRSQVQSALSEAEVQDMRALEPSRRNRLLLRLLYSTGLRPSELCALCWRGPQASGDTGQMVIVGRGGQLRFVPLRILVWEELQAFRGRAGDLEVSVQLPPTEGLGARLPRWPRCATTAA
jgi:site-specific recombinase XerD